MRVIKNINNNVAVCLDGTGNQVVAFGRGIGFKKPPYDIELEDIDQTFYNVDPHVVSALNSIPSDMLYISDKVVRYAARKLGQQFNPNVVFTLADHLTFAIDRAERHVDFSLPGEADIRQLFPGEVSVGAYAIKLIREKRGIELPVQEEVFVAFHLINSEEGLSDSTEKDNKRTIEKISEIVEQSFHIKIDRTSFDYARFSTHMEYLLRRGQNHEFLDSKNRDMFNEIGATYPDTQACVDRISAYLKIACGFELPNEERLYLMLHVNRLCSRESDA